MHSFTQISERFEERLAAFQFPDAHAGLYNPCRYMLTLGGKRVRPALCLMANELFGELHDDAFHAATALELFHNFTLVHDDIMDAAPLRRGQPTVHTTQGLSTAILCGDVLNIYAYTALGRVKHHLPDVMALFNRTAIEVCEGQQMDMEFEQRNDVSRDEYIHMISLKTSVLLAAALQMGGVLGGASRSGAEKLYQFGMAMGIAFQLQDDYLDAFGDPARTGKQAGGDILANKKTIVGIAARERATPAQSEELSHLAASTAPEKVQRTLAVYRTLAADEESRDLVRQHSQQAFEYLEQVPVTGSRKAPLHELAEMLLSREY